MKLSISNIAWKPEENELIFSLMNKYGFTGLEFAPTLLLGENPYNKIPEAKLQLHKLTTSYNIFFSSIQSVFYKMDAQLFGPNDEQEVLFNTLQKAIEFCSALEIHNIVFGAPKNRVIPEDKTVLDIIPFFTEIAKIANANNTVLSMEANPAIYQTNFINTTGEAIQLVKEVNSPGFKVNLDFGTIIENEESLNYLETELEFINHIHISEPFLMPIKRRDEHRELAAILKANSYDGYISIEMRQPEQNASSIIESTLQYIREIFNADE